MSAERWAAVEKWINEASTYARWRKACGDELDCQRWQDAVDDARRILTDEKHAAELSKLRMTYEQKIADVDGIITDLIERHGRAFKNTADTFRETFAAVDDRVDTVKSEIAKARREDVVKSRQPITKAVTYDRNRRIETVTESRGGVPFLRKHVSYIEGTGRIASVREERL